MSNEFLSAPAPGATRASDSPMTLAERKREIARLVAEKLEQGYLIESQADTEAVLTTRGRSRWFGLRGHEAGSRQRISIDEHGRVTKRKC